MKQQGATIRFNDGALATWGKPTWPWGRFSRAGKIHLIETALIRWNGKPRLSFISVCGYQEAEGVFKAPEPDRTNGCLSCRARMAKKGLL